MSKYRLAEEIVSQSVSQIWDAAKLEWELAEIVKEDEPHTCLCGHHPIIKLCTIRNTKNGNLAMVGNCCVKKFLGLYSDKVFQAVARVQKDWWRALNAETIEFAHSKKWISDWEREFYLDTMRKRLSGLTGKQNSKRYEINMKIVSMIVKKRTGQPV